jgi:hypothetical protein
MIQNTTWRLLIAVLVMGSYLWFIERKSETARERLDREAHVLRLTPERVTYLAVAAGEVSIECERRLEGWFLTAPLQVRANAARIEQILTTIESLPQIETITAAQRKARNLTLESYRLSAPRTRLALEVDGRRLELLIGTESPAGDALYVRLSGADKIIATTTNLINVLPQSVEEMRERRILYRDAMQVVRLEIHRPESFVQLAYKDGQWMIQQPFTAEADNAKVESVLRGLAGLTVIDFVADGKADPVAYRLGVDDAAAQAALWWPGDENGWRIFFGKSTQEGGAKIYARRGDIDSIYTVGKDILDILAVRPSGLRERRIFTMKPEHILSYAIQQGDTRTLIERSAATSEWEIIEPVQARADKGVMDQILAILTTLRADRFLDGDSTNLADYGLAPPMLTVEVGGARVSATGETARIAPAPTRQWAARIVVGGRHNNGSMAYGVLGGDRDVFEFRLDRLRFSHPDYTTAMLPAEALKYRSRCVLSLMPQSVRRIVRAAGSEQSAEIVERNPEGKWQVAPPAQGSVQLAVIEGLLRIVNHLQADRLADDKTGRESRYGLDAPSLRLTFGLAGEGAIQKTLVLGAPAGDGSCYAMLQGQDIVFVLGRSLVADLQGHLIQ